MTSKPIQLDKIIANICEEKVLHPNYHNANLQEIEEAWLRVGKNNKLGVHEARSIFKVLQRKYEQEKKKGKPSWKLFAIMDDIHKTLDVNLEEESEDLHMEEDEEYEMLEVQEEEDQLPTSQMHSGSEDGSPPKSQKSECSESSSEKIEEKIVIKQVGLTNKQSLGAINNSTGLSNNVQDEKKILNVCPRTSTSNLPNSSTIPAAMLNKKGITLKKANNSLGSTPKPQTNTKTTIARVNTRDVRKTIQLPESIKRKLIDDAQTTQSKKVIIKSVPSANNTVISSAPVQVKQEKTDDQKQGINIITIPSNPNGSAVSGSNANGFSTRIEDIDFKNDIIFAADGVNVNGGAIGDNSKSNSTSRDIINLGNFDNSLPPTFFKNLCNSSRHEALGLYVANVMNRFKGRAAAKLEMKILRAIIDIQEEFEQ